MEMADNISSPIHRRRSQRNSLAKKSLETKNNNINNFIDLVDNVSDNLIQSEANRIANLLEYDRTVSDKSDSNVFELSSGRNFQNVSLLDSEAVAAAITLPTLPTIISSPPRKSSRLLSSQSRTPGSTSDGISNTGCLLSNESDIKVTEKEGTVDAEKMISSPSVTSSSSGLNASSMESRTVQQKKSEAADLVIKWKVGDVVWGKVSGHPWWPAIIARDPVDSLFYKSFTNKSKARISYHVHFLGEAKERGWITEGSVMEFRGLADYQRMSDEAAKSGTGKLDKSSKNNFSVNSSRAAAWQVAVDKAEQAVLVSLEERLAKYLHQFIVKPKKSKTCDEPQNDETVEEQRVKKRKKNSADDETEDQPKKKRRKDSVGNCVTSDSADESKSQHDQGSDHSPDETSQKDGHMDRIKIRAKHVLEEEKPPVDELSESLLALNGMKKIDEVCMVCEIAGNARTLIRCSGACLSYVHVTCAGEQVQKSGEEISYKCSECTTGIHTCFACKLADMTTVKCSSSCCGKFYHIRCLSNPFQSTVTKVCSPQLSCSSSLSQDSGVSLTSLTTSDNSSVSADSVKCSESGSDSLSAGDEVKGSVSGCGMDKNEEDMEIENCVVDDIVTSSVMSTALSLASDHKRNAVIMKENEKEADSVGKSLKSSRLMKDKDSDVKDGEESRTDNKKKLFTDMTDTNPPEEELNKLKAETFKDNHLNKSEVVEKSKEFVKSVVTVATLSSDSATDSLSTAAAEAEDTADVPAVFAAESIADIYEPAAAKTVESSAAANTAETSAAAAAFKTAESSAAAAAFETAESCAYTIGPVFTACLVSVGTDSIAASMLEFNGCESPAQASTAKDEPDVKDLECLTDGQVYNPTLDTMTTGCSDVTAACTELVTVNTTLKLKKKDLVCPLHTCLTCSVENDGVPQSIKTRMYRCVQCPTAYHANDTCLAAGSVCLNKFNIICSRHFKPDKRNSRHLHVNVNWCFTCLQGGTLVCCETCPAAYHESCLKQTLPGEGVWCCEDCVKGKRPLTGDIVWAKIGQYRWWPGKICSLKEVPDNIIRMKHDVGEFPILFYGTGEYNWLHQGRVFQFEDGDCETTCVKGSGILYQHFLKGLEEAREACKQRNEEVTRRREETNERCDRKPAPYRHVRCNVPLGNVEIRRAHIDEIPQCQCAADGPSPCGPDSDCINRLMMYECHPGSCPAGERCLNQRFQHRQGVNSQPIKTPGRGWGLKVLHDIVKGTFIHEYVGDLIDEAECKRRLEHAHKNDISNFYMLTLDKNRVIDAGPKGNNSRFMNHSCQPNCETQKWNVNGDVRIGLFALEDIPAGTELTFNYNLDCYGNEKTVCHCGTPVCSGFLGVRPKQKVVTAAEGKTVSRRKSSVKKRSAAAAAQVVEHEDVCWYCHTGGELLLCDLPGCRKSYHLSCLSIDKPPRGVWYCPWHHCDTEGCGKRTTFVCSLCPSSYCQRHVPHNLFQFSTESNVWSYAEAATIRDVMRDSSVRIVCFEHEEEDITEAELPLDGYLKLCHQLESRDNTDDVKVTKSADKSSNSSRRSLKSSGSIVKTPVESCKSESDLQAISNETKESSSRKTRSATVVNVEQSPLKGSKLGVGLEDHVKSPDSSSNDIRFFLVKDKQNHYKVEKPAVSKSTIISSFCNQLEHLPPLTDIDAALIDVKLDVKIKSEPSNTPRDGMNGVIRRGHAGNTSRYSKKTSKPQNKRRMEAEEDENSVKNIDVLTKKDEVKANNQRKRISLDSHMSTRLRQNRNSITTVAQEERKSPNKRWSSLEDVTNDINAGVKSRKFS